MQTLSRLLLLLPLPILASPWVPRSSPIPTPTSTPSNCTDSSIHNASWTVSDWSADFRDPDLGGSLIFQLHNNAINFTSLCFRRGMLSQCFWTAGGFGTPEEDDAVETYFALDEGTNTLDVNQTWACAARSQWEGRMIFHGHGTAIILPNCTLAQELPSGVICGPRGGVVQASVTASGAMT
ncbi:hypothetical protein B0T19DRAFT_446023 [Cercophora scortea]|uniref:AA1-like domain-containing protein n=1 Tax=Cercophora scortea TaxID=314031 RepID=A0AAE0I835_9PEZI|nr:hypothetical protein B0T19DRAFT_446023 [Cercophora scortea]